MKRRVAVVGAGPTGAFVAGSLAARGFEVHLFEKREDPWAAVGDGRSIALSISPRGLAALETLGLRAPVEAVSTELVGRAFHPRGGGVRVLESPAGAVRNRALGRAQLTEIVGRWALTHEGVVPRFGEPCLEVLRSERALVSRSRRGAVTVERFDLVLGTDGAASEVRTAIVRSPAVDFGKRVSPWGYREVTVDRTGGDLPARRLHRFPWCASARGTKGASWRSSATRRLKDRFHPRARYLVVVAYGELREALEAWALSCREHIASHPIACTAEVGVILAASANVQPARVLPTLARGGHAALQGVVQGARALFWFRPEPLAPELRATLEARGVPLIADFEAARRFLERTHRAESEGAS